MLINYPNMQQDFSAFITFSSQGSSCPSPTHLCFFSGKIPSSNVAARLTRKYWVPNFRHFVTIPPPPSILTCHYLLLFVTIRDIRHYSHYSYYSSLFAVRYSRLFAIRYSGFPDTPSLLFLRINYVKNV